MTDHEATLARAFLGPAPAVTPAENERSAAWAPPLPLEEHERLPFPVDTLPGWLSAMTTAEATATQTPGDLAGCLGLVALATACGGRVEARVRPGWIEPVNLYITVAQPPAARKTRVFMDMLAPIEAHERELAHDAEQEIAAAASRRKITEQELAHLQTQAAKAEADQRLMLEADADTLARRLATMPVAERPALIIDDCSPERVATVLRNQGGRIAILAPEGDLFDIMAGKYSSNGAANFGVFLRGHAGDTIRVERVNRPAEYIPRPAITIGLTVQPVVIQGLAERPGFRGRGLLGRFLYSMPASLIGQRQPNAPPVPGAVRDQYHERIADLLRLPVGTDDQGQPAPHTLRLGDAAHTRFLAFERELEPRLAEYGDLGSISDWAGKLAGAVARLAGLLHMAEHAGQAAPWGMPISDRTMAAAIALGHYFTAHARIAFALMGCDPEVADARHVLGWVHAAGHASFTRHEAHQKLRGRFQKIDQLDQALRLLEAHDYIRPQPTEPQQGPGRRPGPAYDVNPILHARNTHNARNTSAAPHSMHSVHSVNGQRVSEGAPT